MTIFTQHPHDQGISYLEHLDFAMGIAWRLLRSVVAFAIHALLPWITIEKELDLEATSRYLMDQNGFIETASQAARKRRNVHPLAA